MSKPDNVFIRQFVVVLALLAVYGVAAAFLGIWIAGSARDAAAGSERATLERIAPVGQVRLGEPGQRSVAGPAEGADTGTVVAAADEPPGTGADASPAPSASIEDDELAVKIYKTYCFACHQTGVAQAPRTGDTEQWAARAGMGFDALFQSVLSGKGTMPPRAGFPHLTDEELKAGIRYLLATANVTAD